MVRNSVSASVALALAALVFTGCPPSGAGTGTSGGGSSGNEILVGEYGSMTGSEATFGQSTHLGIMLAVEEQNAAGGVKGKKIKVVSYDDKGDAQEAGNCVMRLTTSDKVAAVLGEVASSLSKAGGRVAQKNGIPMISPSSTNREVTQIGDMIFRVCFIDDFQGLVGAKFAKENLKATKVALLFDQKQAYSTGLKDDFKKAFTGMGGTISSEQAVQRRRHRLQCPADGDPRLQGRGDLRARLLHRGRQHRAASAQARDHDSAPRRRRLGLAQARRDRQGRDRGLLLLEPLLRGGDSPRGPGLREEVPRQEPRYPADGLAALGYDAARLLFDAMGRAASGSGKDLAAAIASTKDFKGVTGIITIDENRNAKKPAVMLQMKNAKPHYMATIAP